MDSATDWRRRAFFDDLTTDEIEVFIQTAQDELMRRLLEEDQPPATVLQFMPRS